MFERPLVIGVRQVGKEVFTMGLEDALMALGRNTGNMMFTQGLLSAIDGATWGQFNVPADVAERHDAIVIAAANWINEFDDFGWLSAQLEKVDLPVIISGIGAQASDRQKKPQLHEGTRRLLDLVKDRSASISVRGAFSAEVLNDLGIQNVYVTGCPSLLLIGAEGPRLRLDEDVSAQRTVIHGTRHTFSKPDDAQLHFYREAKRHGYDLLLQSETSDMYLSLGRSGVEDITKRALGVASGVFGVSEEEANAYLVAHAKTFFNFEDWMAYMAGKSFCFGSRIHGTIAALIAGCPGVLAVHDTRTAEMAETMNIPAVPVADQKDLAPERLADMCRNADFAAFTSGYKAYRDNFAQFFALNKLKLAAG